MNATKVSPDHSALLHRISYDHRNRSQHFLSLTTQEQAATFLHLSHHIQSHILGELTNEQVVHIINHLDPDDATDVLQLLPKKRRETIVSLLNENLKNSVVTLLNFDPQTAAGLMSLDYIQVSSHDMIETVSEKVKRHEVGTGRLPTVLVVDEGKLVGELRGWELVLAKPHEQVAQYTRKTTSVAYNARQEKVLSLFRAHPHTKVIVLGEHHQVVGVIYTDDILKLIQNQQDLSLYNFAGVSNEESLYDPASRKVRFRYKWLMVNLATAFLAAFTVGLFDDTIAKHILLAVYMPVVAGMGGNAATQTLAVMVRGLSQATISTPMLLGVLRNELVSGLANGVLNGILVTTIVTFLNGSLLVGVVLGLAMIINLCIAGTFGTLVPVLMKHLGKDPASSATIFITTATDVFGFLAFLGLASLILK